MKRIITAVVLMLLMLLGTMTTYADNSGDYFRQHMSALNTAGSLSFNSDKLEVAKDSKSDTLLVTGKKSNIDSSTIKVTKEFNFDRNQVGRFTFAACSARGEKIVLGFYLDGSETPFAEKKIRMQSSKDSWDDPTEYTIDISDLKLTGKHKVSMKVESSSSKEYTFGISYFEFVQQSIPVIYLDIDESEGSIEAMLSSQDHSVECYGQMNIKVPEGYTSEYTGQVLEDQSLEMEYIRGRGNSTWQQERNPFKIKLDKKSNVLDMGKSKHWVLLANYYDNSLLRNKITYWLGDRMGLPFTPKCEPVEVVMNGEYLGSYLLSQQIRVGEGNINIDDLENAKEAVTEPEITGGYLLSLSPDPGNETKKSFATSHDIDFLIESPEFDGYTNDAQYNYIKSYVQNIEDAIYSKEFKDSSGVLYSDYLDIHQSALYYMFQEFSMNGDGYCSGSTYLYKPRSGKLAFGPLWDFDYVAWGSTEYDGFSTSGWTMQTMGWNENLLRDPAFCNEIITSWPAFKAALDDLTKAGGQLDLYRDKVATSWEYTFEKYNQAFLDDYMFDSEKRDPMTYDQEIERLRSWINERENWVNLHISNLIPVETTVTYKGYNGKTIYTATETAGKVLTDIPKAPARKGYTFLRWEITAHLSFDDVLADYGGSEETMRDALYDSGYTKEEIDEYISELKENGIDITDVLSDEQIAYRNMVCKAVYVKSSNITQPSRITLFTDKVYGIYSEDSWFELDIPYDIYPADATFQDIDITSSDETIVKYEDGSFVSKGAGDCVITFAASNGVKAKCKVHIYSEKEFMEAGYPTLNTYGIGSSLTLDKGQFKKLKLSFYEANGISYGKPYFCSSDPEIATVSQTGYVTGIKAGTCLIAMNYDGEISFCKVTVKKEAGSVGTTVTRSGLKYRVLSSSKTSHTVRCIGAVNSKATSVTIPSSIKIKGKIYSVTSVGKSSFDNMKKLTKVTIGSNINIIYSKAFANDKKLKKVTIKSRKKPKIYKSAFKGISKKASFYVPKSQKSYYKLILKGKTIKKL